MAADTETQTLSDIRHALVILSHVRRSDHKEGFGEQKRISKVRSFLTGCDLFPSILPLIDVFHVHYSAVDGSHLPSPSSAPVVNCLVLPCSCPCFWCISWLNNFTSQFSVHSRSGSFSFHTRKLVVIILLLFQTSTIFLLFQEQAGVDTSY